MSNIDLLKDYREENIQLTDIKFTSAKHLASFMIYAWNHLDETEFEILMDDLIDII